MRKSFAKKYHLKKSVADVKADCLAEVADMKSTLMTGLVLILLLSIPQLLLAGFAGWYGSDLFRKLGDGQAIVEQRGLSHGPVATEPLNVQPEADQEFEVE